MAEKILEVTNITKTFPGVVALKNVNLELYEKEVLALLGENGAGKSTLIKIISGVHKPDSGEISYLGKKVLFKNPNDAIKQGISTIHQELNLFEELTVAENIFVGNVQGFRFSKRRAFKVVQELLRSLKFDLRPDEKVKNLNTSEKQLVSIAKALFLNARVIIMDEPTATITEYETDRLFEIIRRLKESGVSVIFISHRLEEVYAIADRVTVLRDGELVGTKHIGEVSRDELIKMMVGRRIEEMYPKFNKPTQEDIFSIENLCVGNFVKGISFNVRKGEIFGIAGLVGSGKSEIALGLFGHLPATWSKMVLNGKLLKPEKNMLKHKIALVPEDRKQMGLILELDVVKNIILQNTDEVSKAIHVSWRKAKDITTEEVKKYSVKLASVQQKVKTLSGGNQQKVVLAKVLRKKPHLVMLVEPTRGIDVGTKVEVYNIVNKLANDGVGVIFISSELPEILGLCDRVLVMHRGKAMGIVERHEFSEERIIKLATGVEER